LTNLAEGWAVQFRGPLPYVDHSCHSVLIDVILSDIHGWTVPSRGPSAPIEKNPCLVLFFTVHLLPNIVPTVCYFLKKYYEDERMYE
jgi:hypothetical protein